MPLASTTDIPDIDPPCARSGNRIARWVLCVLACCLAFQGWTLSVERASGRAHVHLDAPGSAAPSPNTASGARTLADLDGHRYAPEIASDHDAAPSPIHRAHDHHGDHSTLAHHDHDAEAVGIVYVAEDDGATTLNPHPALARGVHDLDVVMNTFGVPSGAEMAADWAKAASPAFVSHVGGPLERPPRA